MAKLKPARLVLGYKGCNYKLLSMFFGNDNSVCFHLYRHPGEYPMRPTYDATQDGKTLIHFPGFEPTNIEEDHLSFHRSGQIHSRVNHPSKYRAVFQGLAFDEIEDCRLLLCVAPPQPDQLVRASDTLNPRRDIHLGLGDEIEPFYLQLGIYREKDKISLPVVNETDYNGYIIHTRSGQEFGIWVKVSLVAKKEPSVQINWPPFTLVLKRVS